MLDGRSRSSVTGRKSRVHNVRVSIRPKLNVIVIVSCNHVETASSLLTSLRASLLVSQLTSSSHMVFSGCSCLQGCPSSMARVGASIGAVSKGLFFSSTTLHPLNNTIPDNNDTFHPHVSVQYYHSPASYQGDGSDVSRTLRITSKWICRVRYRHHSKTA